MGRYRYRSVTPLYYTQYSMYDTVYEFIQSTCTVAHCNILLYNPGYSCNGTGMIIIQRTYCCTIQYMYTAVPTLSNFLLGEELHRSARKRFFNCEKKYSV